MSTELFELLLTRHENRHIDFKAQAYWDGKKTDDGAFVKDLLGMANSVRSETAYLIYGVKKTPDGNTTLIGVNGFLDDASLQEKIKKKISPQIEFESYTFPYKGKTYGIIEIPVCYYSRPLSSTVKLTAVEPGKIYLRNGSSNQPATEQEILKINAWLETIAPLPPKPLPPKRRYDAPAIHINRTVTNRDDDVFSYFSHASSSLEDEFPNQKKIALLAWGLDGKSTELAYLAHKLSSHPFYFPVLILLNDYADESIAYFIEELDAIPQDRLVLLLDGLDEVIRDDLRLVTKKISQFLTRYPDIHIVVSCRSNLYMTVENGSVHNTLPGFSTYLLDPLTQVEVENYLKKHTSFDTYEFFGELSKKQIRDLIHIPYHLTRMASEFENTHRIEGNRASIFKKEITQLIAKDMLRDYPLEHVAKERQLYQLLKRAAFIMESKASNMVETTELMEIFPEKTDYDLVTNAATIFRGTDSVPKKWRFHHYHVQEFLAAEALAAAPFRGIKKVIAFGPDFTRIKPTWVNTVSFLNNLIGSQSALRKRISAWIARHNKELIIRLEPENLAIAIRTRIFTSIIKQYSKDNRRINTVLYRMEDLARFSETESLIGFLIAELKNNRKKTAVANALGIINYYHLDQYPKFSGLLKDFYEQYVFGDDGELQAIALMGYTQHFNLNDSEFNRMFLHFSESEDTTIRYTLFQALRSQGSKELFLDYILAEAKTLIREDRQINNGTKKDRDPKEFIEIARCLEKVTSKAALLKILSVLQAELYGMAHAHHFEKTLPVIFENASRYQGDNAIISLIINIFLADHSGILHDLRLSPLFLDYLKNEDQIEIVCQALFPKIILGDASAINSVSLLASRAVVDELRSEFTAGNLSQANVTSLLYFMEKNENAAEGHFRNIFDLPKVILPVRNFQKEERIRHERNLSALFDKSAYKQEISLIFETYGKDVILYSGIHGHEIEYWSDKFALVAREALDLGPGRHEAHLSELHANIDLFFDGNQVTKIYHYLNRHGNPGLNEKQTGFLTGWCNIMASTIDLKVAMQDYIYPEWIVDEIAEIFVFFIRKLKLTLYPKKLYLDLLSFVSHDHILDSLFDFVAGICEPQEIKSEVLKNLANGISIQSVLKGHMDYIKKHGITEACPLLVQYLAGEDSEIRYTVLRLYIELGGTLDRLKPLLHSEKGYFRNAVIDEFMKKDRLYITIYLLDRFRIEADEEEKLALSRYLISLQQAEGITFYSDYVRRHKHLPDDRAHANPLSLVNDVRLTQYVLELFLLAKEPGFKFTRFNDLTSIAMTSLTNLALYQENFALVKQIFKRWITRKKIRAFFGGPAFPDKLQDEFQFYWELIEQQYYAQRPGALTTREALTLYENIPD